MNSSVFLHDCLTQLVNCLSERLMLRTKIVPRKGKHVLCTLHTYGKFQGFVLPLSGGTVHICYTVYPPPPPVRVTTEFL